MDDRKYKNLSFSTPFERCLRDWNLEVVYRCNWDANGNSQEIREYKEGDVAIRLHKRGDLLFLEQRIDGTMYPQMYKVKSK